MFSFSVPKYSFAAAGVAAAVGLIGFVEVSPVQAATVIKNGDFSNGLTGWSSIGNVGTSGEVAQLSNSGGQGTAAIENFLGLTSGTIATLGSNPTIGSAIKQTFEAKEGTALRFSWRFQAGDYLPFNDFAFYSLAPTGASTLSNVARVGNNGDSGWVNLSFVAPTTGLYTLGFGVMNSTDNAAASLLLVDNVEADIVPTPALLPGLIGLGAAAIRRRKQGEVEQEA